MQQQTETKPTARNFNKPAYVVYVFSGIYFLIQQDFSQAVIFWGLALVFDPFQIDTPFNKRPLYQQIWLFVHLAITLGLFVLMIMVK